MPTFELSAPDGGTYQIDAPDEHAAVAAFSQIGQRAAAPAAGDARFANPEPASALRGVPVVGAYVNKAGAAVSAAAHDLTGVGADGGTFGERYQKNLAQEDAAEKQYEQAHPVADAVNKTVGGSLAMVPVMAAAPAAFGLAGPMSTMVRNGAISGAAISAADAAARGEDVGPAALTGGFIGGAAGPVGKGVGKLVSAVADRFRPPAVVPQNVARVGNVDVPLSESQVTQNPAASAEEQILLRGGRGDAAQTTAQGFRDKQDAAINQARGDIGAALDPSGGAATTSPQDAAERVAAELIAQESAKSAAAARDAIDVQSSGARFAHAMDPAGQMRGATPFDAAENLSEGLARARDAAKSDYRGKYDATAQQPGEFAPGSAAGFRADVENGLRNAENPVSLDATNTPKAIQALRVIDSRMNLAGPAPVAPVVSEAPGLGAQHVQNVADIRAKFGDDVAAAYDRQKAAAVETPSSLLQFIASKGGLAPHPELEAIGLASGHREQIPGRSGFFGVVSKNGSDIDRMREAAEEAGYLRGSGSGTSTPAEFLDAIDAELRGQKRYPEGFEGFQTKRQGVARSEREQHEYDHFNQGLEDDLAAAGHSGLAPDVKARAVDPMAKEGMHPDDAVEHAMRQLDQEDAAGLGRSSVPDGAFPGDVRPAPVAAREPATAQSPGSTFTMRDVEQVRKELSTLYGDARKAMMAGGSGSDLHAIEHIRDQFDLRVERMISEGKFSGDGPAVLQMQKDARASFADYKQKFAKRGAGDEVGAAVEKILGKFSDTKATPDTIVNLAYGSASAPGGQMPVRIAQRIIKIFGKGSEEFAAYKQGLFAHLTAGEPEKAAARIVEFLNGTKGRLLAQTAFDPGERIALARQADKLRGIAPKANDPGAIGAAVRRITGADGAPAAPTNEVVNYLYGATGKGAGRVSVPLALHLKKALSAEGWAAVRQGMWEKLTNAGEGKIPFEAQALSQRLHEFLNESGSQLATVLFSEKERKLMQQLASVYKQMIPVKGTTNPSGTAPMLARIASGARHTLLPLLGFTHGGVPGAAVAYGIDKGLNAIGNAKAARNATKMFYGSQARRAADPRFTRPLGLLSQGSLPEINERRSR